MSRPRIQAGEVGAVQITKLADGRVRARARMRDDAGELRQLKVTADTEEDALAELRRAAALLTSGGAGMLSGSSTIAEAADAWLVHANGRADAGSLAHSTLESCESAVRLILKPMCGAVTLDQLTVGRCDRIIQSIMREGLTLEGAQSPGRARTGLRLRGAG